MPRPEKVRAVAEIKERLESAQAVFLAEYAGLSVKEQQQLRRTLRAASGQFRIVKMTLARRAAVELGHEGLVEMLTGPTGLTFADGDAAATAKALRDFANDHTKMIIKGGLFSGEILPPERVHQLADLEPRDVLLARVAGAFQAPMAKMAGLLAAMPRNLASMIQQLIEKRDEPAAAPAGVADAAEAQAVEPAVEGESEAPGPGEAEPTDPAPAETAPAEDSAEPAAIPADEKDETAVEAEEE